MTVSVNTSGSQTTTAATEHVLATVATAGAYALAVDCAALTGTDVLRLRIYGKARSADAERLIWDVTFQGNMLGEALKMSPAFMSPHHAKFTMECSASSLAFPWAVYSA